MATIKVTVTGTHFGSTVQNTYHLLDNTYVVGHLTTIANYFDATFLQDVNVKNKLPSEFAWTNIQTRRVDSGTDAPFNKPTLIAGTAGVSGAALPMNCVVMKLQTATAGRHGRGRIYWPGLGPACLNAGLLTPACVTAYQALGGSILSHLANGGGLSIAWLVIAERQNLSLTHDVTACTPRTTAGTQRRRNFGVGM